MHDSDTQDITTHDHGAADDAGHHATGRMKAKAEEIRHNVAEEAKNIASQAAQSARDAAGKGKDKAVEAASGLTRMLEESAAVIDRELGDDYGKYVHSAAHRFDDLVKSIDARDVDELLEEAREFVRKSPAITIGAAAAAGFLLARLVKSGLDND